MSNKHVVVWYNVKISERSRESYVYMYNCNGRTTRLQAPCRVSERLAGQTQRAATVAPLCCSGGGENKLLCNVHK